MATKVMFYNVMTVRPAAVEPARRWLGGAVTPFREKSETARERWVDGRSRGFRSLAVRISTSGLSGITNNVVEIKSALRGERQFYVGSLLGSESFLQSHSVHRPRFLILLSIVIIVKLKQESEGDRSTVDPGDPAHP
ncbi:hypothetical protein CDV55_100863 [Aspergillus turcosus]|nr:hypothetical protein CDV55_100863 [Aspergillus turcosus]